MQSLSAVGRWEAAADALRAVDLASLLHESQQGRQIDVPK